MNKSIIFITICIISIVGIVIFTSFYLISKREDSTMIRQTEKEVERINNNSNLLGFVLLSIPPADSVEGMSIEIVDREDNCYCNYFDDRFLITQINIISSDGHVLGISPGDNIEKVKKIMAEEGYSEYPNSSQERQVFTKYYAFINFNISEDGFVNWICVGVDDPSAVYIDF